MESHQTLLSKIQSRTCAGVSSILELPNCVLSDILCRLPTNTVSECRFVCKSWHDLIFSDPDFHGAYRNSPPFISLLVSIGRKLETFRVLEFDWNLKPRTLSEPLRMPFDHRYGPKLKKFRTASLVGCSNGLICMRFCNADRAPDRTSPEELYVFNPLREEYVLLPLPNLGTWIHDQSHEFGFGYDASTGLYKVLAMAPKYDGTQLYEPLVYTLGHDQSWRNLEPVSRYLRIVNPMVLFNGALHWINAVCTDKYYIQSFSLKDERFSSIPPPPEDLRKCSKRLLRVLDDCLSVIVEKYVGFTEKASFFIWSLSRRRVNGVEEYSWSKRRVMELDDSYCGLPYKTPVASWRDGEVLVNDRRDNSRLVSCEVETGECCSFSLENLRIGKEFLSNVVPFVTSSVPLRDVVPNGHLEVIKMT